MALCVESVSEARQTVIPAAFQRTVEQPGSVKINSHSAADAATAREDCVSSTKAGLRFCIRPIAFRLEKLLFAMFSSRQNAASVIPFSRKQEKIPYHSSLLRRILPFELIFIIKPSCSKGMTSSSR